MTQSSTDKLPIYDSPATPNLLVAVPPSSLELYIGSLRRSLTGYFHQGNSMAKGAVTKWIDTEKQAEAKLKELKSPQESLTPGLLYVGIAGLSGSILARNRNFLLRFSLPPLLLFTTALYALPRTTANVRAEMWDLETTRIPAFARFHATAYDHSLMALDRVKEGTETIRERFDSSAKGIGGFIQDKSGVKMGDLVHSQERFGGSSAEAGTVERLEKAVDVPGKESSEKRVL